jgi:uncharacterized protein
MKTHKEHVLPWPAVAASCALLCVPLAAFGASFDCSKAHSDSEKIICADPVLSAEDDELARAYRKALAQAPDKAKFKKEASDAGWRVSALAAINHA